MQLLLTQLRDNPKSPNVCTPQQLKKLKNNIKRVGHYQPLIVWEDPENPGQYIILDGHQRKRVLEELGYETADCQIWTLSAVDAQLTLASLNRLRGTDIPLKRAELIATLTETLSLEDLAALIPEDEAEIKDLLRWVNQDLEAMEAALKKETEREEASLPISLNFLLSPQEHAIWKSAYEKFNQQGDLTLNRALIAICHKATEEPNV